MQYRGMIKWTQMAIPEHLEMIRKERKEKRKPIKPQLDEQELNEIGYVIEEKLMCDNLRQSIIGT
ncbi:YolD-like family protein (plasmid) [Alkalihalophilus sp. As8PL]|uniref:YolD-like family protein n=1 Tax=Alkalihalophilus sp. As8PL TaxID=3237103 RepID=A0AB39BNV8_9BACI